MSKKERKVHRISFNIEVEGTVYQCEREVIGTTLFQQTVTVTGVGSKEDSARYDKTGKHGHRVSGMAGAADSIAREIISAKDPNKGRSTRP